MEYIDLLEKNFYDLLGLDQNQLYDNNGKPIESENSIDIKIEKAYRQKNSKTSNDIKQNKLLRDAYNVLKDRKKRNEYNQLRKLIEKYNAEKKVKKEVANIQQKKITTKSKNVSEITKEEYEEKLKDYNKILSIMQENAKKIQEEDKIKFIPIYKGKFIKSENKKTSEDNER